MAITSIDKGNVDSFIPELLAMEVHHNLPNYLNLTRTVRTDFELATAKQGETITIPAVGSFSTNPKTANDPVTRQAPDDSETTVTLDEHEEITWSPEDVARVFAKQNLVEEYGKEAARALGEKLEEDLAGLYSSFSNSLSASGDNDYGVTLADLVDARTKATTLKWPKLAERYLYMHPDAYGDLLKQDEFNDASKQGSDANLVNGALRRCMGFQFFEGQLTETSGSPTTQHNMAYTRNAMVLAVRPLPNDAEQFGGAKQQVISNPATGLAFRMTTSYLADYLAPQITLDVLYGYKVVRPELCFDFQTQS